MSLPPMEEDEVLSDLLEWHDILVVVAKAKADRMTAAAAAKAALPVAQLPKTERDKTINKMRLKDGLPEKLPEKNKRLAVLFG